MSGRLTIDLLIDRLKSVHVPAPKGAKMRPYDPQSDRDALSGLLVAYNNCWRAGANFRRLVIGHAWPMPLPREPDRELSLINPLPFSNHSPSQPTI